jgi:hypothetical protein
MAQRREREIYKYRYIDKKKIPRFYPPEKKNTKQSHNNRLENKITHKHTRHRERERDMKQFVSFLIFLFCFIYYKMHAKLKDEGLTCILIEFLLVILLCAE